MNYEEKYKEALERAKKFEEKYGGDYAGYIFPELAEIEDERIRKHIIKILNRLPGCYWYGQKEKDDCLAYLEKHKPVEWRPSDEQIKAMGYFVRKHQATANHATTTWPEFEAFKSLYNDLKKLQTMKQYNESVEVMKEVSDNVDKTEEELTEFELALRNAMSDTVTLSEDKEDYVISEIADKQAKRYSAELLALAKKELCRGCNANIEGYIKGREDAEKRYNEGYNKGYEDAEKWYNESVAYHYPEPVPPGAAYKSPQCYTDVMITPNTQSGTSTLKAEG